MEIVPALLLFWCQSLWRWCFPFPLRDISSQSRSEKESCRCAVWQSIWEAGISNSPDRHLCRYTTVFCLESCWPLSQADECLPQNVQWHLSPHLNRKNNALYLCSPSCPFLKLHIVGFFFFFKKKKKTTKEVFSYCDLLTSDFLLIRDDSNFCHLTWPNYGYLE